MGTADFALDDCPPGFYRSVVVVRADDNRHSIEEFATGTLAFNSIFSQSGYAALFNHLGEEIKWSGQKLHTGSHLASIQAIATSKADIAAIDAVTWRIGGMSQCNCARSQSFGIHGSYSWFAVYHCEKK